MIGLWLDAEDRRVGAKDAAGDKGKRPGVGELFAADIQEPHTLAGARRGERLVLEHSLVGVNEHRVIEQLLKEDASDSMTFLLLMEQQRVIRLILTPEVVAPGDVERPQGEGILVGGGRLKDRLAQARLLRNPRHLIEQLSQLFLKGGLLRAGWLIGMARSLFRRGWGRAWAIARLAGS